MAAPLGYVSSAGYLMKGPPGRPLGAGDMPPAQQQAQPWRTTQRSTGGGFGQQQAQPQPASQPQARTYQGGASGAAGSTPSSGPATHVTPPSPWNQQTQQQYYPSQYYGGSNPSGQSGNSLVGSFAGGGGGAAGGGTGGATNLLGSFPFQNPGVLQLGNSPWDAQNATLPYPSTGDPLFQQNVNRAFEQQVQQAPSMYQMLSGERPASSGILRSRGDEQKMAGQLAKRSGNMADALAGTQYAQQLANEQQLLQNESGANNFYNQLGSDLTQMGQQSAKFNLGSILANMNLGYGLNSAQAGLLGSLLGGTNGLLGGTLSGVMNGILGQQTGGIG